MKTKQKEVDWFWVLLTIAGAVLIYFGIDGLISGKIDIRRATEADINNNKFRFYFYVTCYFVFGLAMVVYSLLKMIRRESSND